MLRLLPAALILLFAAAPGLAQGNAAYGDAAGLNPRTTNGVLRMLDHGLRQCRSLDSVYRYDCYRQNYSDAARRLDGNAAYAPAAAALRQVESALQSVLRANADPATAPVRQRGRTYTAITTDAVPQSRAAFTRALDQARTQLLRSPDGTGDHFARIASRLDSDKVFLRS